MLEGDVALRGNASAVVGACGAGGAVHRGVVGAVLAVVEKTSEHCVVIGALDLVDDRNVRRASVIFVCKRHPGDRTAGLDHAVHIRIALRALVGRESAGIVDVGAEDALIDAAHHLEIRAVSGFSEERAERHDHMQHLPAGAVRTAEVPAVFRRVVPAVLLGAVLCDDAFGFVEILPVARDLVHQRVAVRDAAVGFKAACDEIAAGMELPVNAVDRLFRR